jgi:Fe-Mn family superoxide dismutase
MRRTAATRAVQTTTSFTRTAAGARSLFTLNDPPYLKTGLTPAISANTLNFHFNGHHKAYLNKTNDLIKGTPLENKSLEDVILVAKTTNNAALFNNSAQLWNHSFYWDCMAPVGETGEISAELEQLIKESFGSVAEFKKKFTDSAVANFGSGWTWLVNINGKLEIQNTSNAESPVTLRVKPLLTLDVWEHAYYLDHQNRRPEYINKWWDVVNWNFVNKQLKQ